MAGAFAVAPGWTQQGQNPPSQAQAGQFRVVRSVSGSKGEARGNDFVMSDPRTEFKIPQDKQVIVFFEWDGPQGTHRFQGTWRGPDGKVAFVSNSQLESRESRFHGYWTLTLPQVVTPGQWTLEAQIDGQSAGVHTFQILVDEGAAPGKPLSKAEVYDRALGAMVFVDRLDAAGNRIKRGSGFFVNPNLVLTAFENIDGASALQIELPGGGQQKITEVAGWNRAADWALLRVNAQNARELTIGRPGFWKIGDLDYLLDAPEEGGRTIQQVAIAGVQNVAGHSQRIYVSWAGDIQSVGSPLLNQQGQVVGLLGGGPLSGMGGLLLNAVKNGTTAETGVRAALMVVPMIEVAPLPPTGNPATLAEMSARGMFMPPLPRNPEIMTGYVCENYRIDPAREPIPVNIRGEFSRNLGTLATIVMWRGENSRKTTEELRIYDSENRKVGGASPREIHLNKDRTLYAAWKFAISTFHAGIYRIDVLAGDQVEWRAYFVVTE
jgi:hypothetical protein